MWGSQREHRVRDARNVVPELQAGTCLEGPTQLNREELEEQEEAARGLGGSDGALWRGRRVPGAEVVIHIAPCLFTWGMEPRGKKVVYFTSCHGHMEVVPL